MAAPTIVTRAQWGARPARSVVTVPWSERTTVAVHHTAGPTTQTVKQLQDYAMDVLGWSDGHYNILVTQDGRVWIGRGWDVQAAHATGHNRTAVSIGWIGDSSSVVPTVAALRSIRWCVGEANRRAGRSLAVRGHQQLAGAATACPGARLAAWLAAGMPLPDTEESTVSTPRETWKYRDIDYVNDSPTTKDHQLARAHEYSFEARNQLRSELPKLAEGQAAILAAVAGSDLPTILAKIDAVHAEQMAAIRAQDQALEQARAERAEILELLERVGSGELSAAEVVRLIGEALRAPGDGES